MGDFFSDMNDTIAASRNEPKAEKLPPQTSLATVNPAPPPEATGTPSQVAPITPGVDLSDIFGVVPKAIKQASADVQDAASNVDQTLNTVAAVTQRAQAHTEAATAQAVTAKLAVNNTIQQETQDAIDKTKPLFARKTAIAQRQDELNQMNPLLRAVKGVFDRNYNKQYLARDDQAVTGEIQSQQEQYTTLTTLQDRLNSTFDNALATGTALDKLHTSDAAVNVQIAAQRLQAARGKLGDLVTGVQANTEVQRAQILAANDALDKAGPSELNQALAEAAKNGGTGSINGVQVSTQQVKTRMDQLQKQALALTAAQQEVTSGGLRIQGQKIALNDAIEDHLLTNMSGGDVKQALNDGGMYHGRQLDVVKLGQRLQNIGATQDQVIDNSSIPSGVRNAQLLTHAFSDKVAGTVDRATAIFGKNLPPELTNSINAGTSHINNMLDAINTIKDPDTRQRALAKSQASILTEIQGMDAATQTAVERMTSNKDAQVALKGWMTGNKLTQEQSTDALVAFTQAGSMPPGVVQGPALDAINRASAARARLEQTQAYKEAKTQGERNTMLRQTVSQAAGASFTGAVTQQINNAAPTIARQMGHPFGSMVSDESFQGAATAGDAIGKQRFMAAHNINDKEYSALFSGNGAAVLKKIGDATKAPVTQAQLGQELFATQSSAFLNQLDAIKPGAAKAYTNLLGNPKVQETMGQMAENAGAGGFSSSLIADAAGGTLRSSVQQSAKVAIQQFHMNGVQAKIDDANRYGQYGSDPYKRAGAALAMTPELSQHDRTVLLGALKQTVGSDEPDYGVNIQSGLAAEDSANESTFLQIGRAITSTKFQDPNLERIRKIAAKDWQGKVQGADRVVSHLVHTPNQ